jgi:hypothetical protein
VAITQGSSAIKKFLNTTSLKAKKVESGALCQFLLFWLLDFDKRGNRYITNENLTLNKFAIKYLCLTHFIP